MTGEAFFARPFAHRGLHDRSAGVIENSRAACIRAVSAGYAIEIDVQCALDGVAMVFHDDDLDRLTNEKGLVRDRTAAALGRIGLTGGGEGIPTLAEVLALVDGAVPLVIELKDQSGVMGPDRSALPHGVASALSEYSGPVAAMSFNPYAMMDLKRLAPRVRRGLVSYDYADSDLPEAVKAPLRNLAFFDEAGADFVSFGADSFPNDAVAGLRAKGAPVLCWTIRSPEQAAAALQHCDQITFEGYRPPV